MKIDMYRIKYFVDNIKIIRDQNMLKYLDWHLFGHESASICCEDGWVITNTKNLSILLNEIEELIKNKTSFDIYYHKYNVQDFYESIDYYHEYQFYGTVTQNGSDEQPLFKIYSSVSDD